MHNLGITHILNVSHNIPNTFEESKNTCLKYQRISIEDSSDVPIDLSFNIAYDFIEKALRTKSKHNMRFYQTKFDLVQNFVNNRKKSAVLVSSAAMTHELILDLNAKKVDNVENLISEKSFDIDQITQIATQKSNNQHRVLVHCAMGMSRSATMVIMYLMRKFEVDWNMAFDIVKTRREIIDPNTGFLEKLQNYEGKQYKLKRTITVKSNEEIAEVDECDIYSDAESSTSSEEDLMETKRKYSVDI